MVHAFKIKNKNIVLDVNSGCVHVVDDLCYEIISKLCENELLLQETLPDEILTSLSTKFSCNDIKEAYKEIYTLYIEDVLFSKDTYENIAINMKKKSPVKAMCLHVSHDCNLRCKYCFADEGTYHEERSLMSAEVGMAAMDYLIKNSGKRRNLEVDFFGGEPLMNFDVVKKIVEYAREQEKIHDKNFRFTITTNGLL
ncbi:MAG: 4Fe-4S cluster-binding domain-containing protein, partial [Oscillospiraceae bacterium]